MLHGLSNGPDTKEDLEFPKSSNKETTNALFANLEIEVVGDVFPIYCVFHRLFCNYLH